jgi:SNF2 family DNA or RNA helicase
MLYPSKKEPWPHQVEALKRLEGKKAFALLLQMRCGKTKVTLDDFVRCYEQDKVDDLLVIAPAGVYITWLGAIEDHVNDDLIEIMRIKTWSSAKAKGADERRSLNFFLNYHSDKRPRVFIMNVEALGVVKNAQQAVLDFCKERRVYCVIDESTCIKNPSAKRTKLIIETIRDKCEYRRILTGLIAPRDPLDVYSQFNFLQPECLGYSTFASFAARYAIIQKKSHMKFGSKFNYTKPVGFRDKEELALRMSWHSYRVRLADCYDLPPKIYEIRNVELTDYQERLYEELKKFATAELESSSFVTAPQAIVQIMRLHQILMGHTVDENGVEHSFGTNRINELMNIIEEWDDGESKAIIWCSYDSDVHSVVEALRKAGYGVARFWGGNRNIREQEEGDFKQNPSTRFMVATAAAGGRGRTWTQADLVIYFSNTWNLEFREQSEERAQGVGKTKNVLYIDLVAVRQNGSETIDMRILKTLRNKINMASILMGDGWRNFVV